MYRLAGMDVDIRTEPGRRRQRWLLVALGAATVGVIALALSLTSAPSKPAEIVTSGASAPVASTEPSRAPTTTLFLPASTIQGSLSGPVGSVPLQLPTRFAVLNAPPEGLQLIAKVIGQARCSPDYCGPSNTMEYVEPGEVPRRGLMLAAFPLGAKLVRTAPEPVRVGQKSATLDRFDYSTAENPALFVWWHEDADTIVALSGAGIDRNELLAIASNAVMIDRAAWDQIPQPGPLRGFPSITYLLDESNLIERVRLVWPGGTFVASEPPNRSYMCTGDGKMMSGCGGSPSVVRLPLDEWTKVPRLRRGASFPGSGVVIALPKDFPPIASVRNSAGEAPYALSADGLLLATLSPPSARRPQPGDSIGEGGPFELFDAQGKLLARVEDNGPPRAI